MIELNMGNIELVVGRKTMKILVTGAKGQLGHDVINELKKRNHTPIGVDIEEMDITNERSVHVVLNDVNPDAVIHCAAWTAVDAAEDCKDRVHAVNAEGTKYIAESCRKLGCKMMYISTDYVFDGHGEEPWEPDCKEYAPLNIYGKSKLDGELAVATLLEKYFIVRIAWVFGANGNNFVKTMLNVGKKFDTLRVVSDQVGTPTYTYDLARLLADMVETEKYGYYHATNEGGYISWYEFACEIFKKAYELGYEEYGPDRLKVNAVTTEEYGLSKAARPFNSRLNKEKLTRNGFQRLPEWKDALGRYLKEIEI